MIRCLDIHTHHEAPQPQAVVSASVQDFNPIEGQFYSLGIHPWLTDRSPSPEVWKDFEEKAALPCVVAIGECGIDKIKGGPMFLQLLVWKKQIEISEKLGKPMIIHDVKAHDVIVGIKKDLQPKQKWVVHGFRAKPTVVKMLTDIGIYLSYGENFNTESLIATPKERVLAETDESPLSIEQIISNLSEASGQDLTSLIEVNTVNFLFGNLYQQ